jgi:ribosomal protein S27AE
MPDKEVQTVRQLIYYQYAKIIARSAFRSGNGKLAKREHYGFIKKTFRELRNGTKSWSDITREDWQFVESEKRCAYCGSEESLQKEHIVPRSIRINPRCPDCDVIQGIHNQVWACSKCNTIKKDKGLYSFYKLRFPEEKKYYDIIPPLVEKKYLKTAYHCHDCAETLDRIDVDGDGEIGVLDIDTVFSKQFIK